MNGGRRGRQLPTFERVGEYAESDGQKAVEFFESLGSTFYPSQEYEMELFLAKNADGTHAADVAVSKPRQNGKSYAARHYALWAAAVEGKAVLYTAHHGDTVREMFRQLSDAVESEPVLASALKPDGNGVYRAAGNEGIFFADWTDADGARREGGRIDFKTRTSAGGRGRTYDLVIVDEAQEFTEDQSEAILPTTIASGSGNAQTIYIGTPPGPKCAGTVFKGLHDRAHAGTGETWWLEWASDRVPDLDDVDGTLELAYETNPALGYKIRETAMRKAISAATTADGFAREYLGWWSKGRTVNPAIPEGLWVLCETEPPTPSEDETVCAGVKFTPDGERVAVSMAARRDGRTFVECVFMEPMSKGTGWLAEWLADRRDRVAEVWIDGKSDGPNLAMRLADAGYPRSAVTVMSTKQVTDAASLMLDAVREKTVVHARGALLDGSAESAQRRRIGSREAGAWGFGDGAVPCAPVESASFAHMAAATTKRNPRRKLRIG